MPPVLLVSPLALKLLPSPLVVEEEEEAQALSLSRLVTLAPRLLLLMVPMPVPSSLPTPVSMLDAPTCKSVKSSSLAVVEEEEPRRLLPPLPRAVDLASLQALSSSLDLAVVTVTATLDAAASGPASALVPSLPKSVTVDAVSATPGPTTTLPRRSPVPTLRRLPVSPGSKRVAKPLFETTFHFSLFKNVMYEFAELSPSRISLITVNLFK
jgi:hypothetical protein